ncbi:hypothetical protein [Hymenobacter negativus]|uniref:DUF2834 domain-containing protein n=1 Tax=Hymenobacter negativus TaxID=2795026 RepID=A0ABS3QLS4_9BACT|nr:hypothetical protein [Hymenobacter negativus]MBO2012191.1 hypothetical protein [Hymenobacter negativus]
MQSSPPVAPAPSFNALLGAGLVLANTLLLYWYLFYYEVSENDQLFYGPVLATSWAAQWMFLAAGSARPWRVWYWVVAGLSGAAAGLLWLGYFWLRAFARGFNH